MSHKSAFISEISRLLTAAEPEPVIHMTLKLGGLREAHHYADDVFLCKTVRTNEVHEKLSFNSLII